MKKYSLLAVLLVAIGALAWTQNSTEIWLKGPVYLGTAKTQLSTVTGTINVTQGITTGITAFAGGGAASATALTTDNNVVSTCATAADSVKLPAAASSREITVHNQGAAALAVFPGSGDTINGGSADASVTVPVNGMAVFRGLSSSAWKVSPVYDVNGGVNWTGATGTNVTTVPNALASAFLIESSDGADLIKLDTTTDAMTITPPLTVTGAATFSSTVGSGNLAVTGTATISSTLDVTGAVGVTGAMGVTGILTAKGGLVSDTTTTLTGVATFTVPAAYSVAATVSAAGADVTDCTALTKEINVVTSATSLQGVCLIAAVAGKKQVVHNGTAVSIMVYPKDSDQAALKITPMAALGTDVGFAIGPGGQLECDATSATVWKCRADLGVSATLAGAGTTIADFGSMLAVSLGSHVRGTGANGTVGITLPEEDVATCIKILNGVSTAVLKLSGDPGDSDTIAGGAADAEFNLGASASVLFCTVDGSAWLAY